MDVQNNEDLFREMGLKLANFRKKLALAIGQKKITQPAFGEMFGGFTKRQIGTFESGEVEVPGRLLYLIFKSGNSVDAIFDEREIAERGAKEARRLYAECSLVGLDELDKATQEKMLKEARNARPSHVEPAKTGSAVTSGRDSKGRGTARQTKKH